MFLANYSDGLTDARPCRMIEFARRRTRSPASSRVCPSQSFHVVRTRPTAGVERDPPRASDCDLRINGGFFVLRADDLRLHAARRGAGQGAVPAADREKQLTAYAHDGFWACMDTFKEKQMLDEMHEGAVAVAGVATGRGSVAA